MKESIKVRLRQLQRITGRIFRSRLLVLRGVFCLTSSILICRCFCLQIIRGEEYTDNTILEQVLEIVEENGIHQQMISRTNIKIRPQRISSNICVQMKYMVTTIATGVSTETAAAIMENKDVLTGVDIAEDPVRKYTDSEVLSSIIGYTGQISEEEYSVLSEEEQENRSRTDIVGKSGIEKAFDDILRGTNGETTFYVDMILSGSCFADSIRMGRSKRQSRRSDVNSYPSMPGIMMSRSRRS